jgi:beta-mannanase
MLPVWLSSATPSGAAPAVSVAQWRPARPPAIPGPGQAYLGAFVDPKGDALSTKDPTGSTLSAAREIAALPAFNQGLGRPLSVVQVFQNWQKSVTRLLLVTQLDQISAAGAIPLINWGCGDTDAHVAAGADDAVISAFARKLATSGVPVFLRWYDNPNVSSPGNNVAGTRSCLGHTGPRGYVAAFRHIHALFEAAHATNVAFVWSMDTSAGTPDSWRSFFPGSADVDWIGADGYYAQTAVPAAGTMNTEFGSWYSAFSTYGKPMMISDTGAAKAPGVQSAYLKGLMADLPTQFPLIKSVIYFDAPDPSTDTHYSLGPSGLAAFQGLSDNSYFQPSRAASTTRVVPSSHRSTVAQVVKLAAVVRDPDRGGSLDFLDNGNPIPGCASVPVRLASSCDTSALPTGRNQIVAVFSGDALSAGSTSDPITVVVGPVAAVDGPPAIPSSGQAYLGAWIKPLELNQLPTRTTPIGEELQLLPQFNSGLARPLGVVHVYQPWSELTPNYQLRQVLADGAIPMIDWSCGDTDANIVAGADDSLISSFAQQLAALKAPVFLRWYYEPNFPGSPTYAACISTLGPAGYVAAFRHIHDLFAAAGATNVAFVWTIASSAKDPDFNEYYPGSAYVDWVSADGYDRSSVPQPTVFAKRFGKWYADFASFGKPLMISETAAVAGAQATFLQEIQSDMPSHFPLLKAVIYFDAAAHTGRYDYPLDASGLSAFQALSRDPVFLPQRQPTAVGAVSASPTSPLTGQEVRLTTSLSPTDTGGSVSFYLAGSTTPLAGCADVAVSSGTSCNTDVLPAGTSSIMAVYSGDAEFAPSTSAPARLEVTAQRTPTSPLAPEIPGPGYAYLGAWVNPNGQGPQPQTEIKNLPGLNRNLGRSLSIVHVYQSWTDVTPTWQIRQVRSSGAIPMIDWQCGDSDANIIAGADDPLITAFAQQLAQLKTPIFLRWYYEPNLPASANYANCIGADGPSGYQVAFQHIHNLFEAAGATNVAFVWSIAAGGPQDDLTSYYPGSAYVDWIAADGYARTSTPGPAIVRNLFDRWYNQFSSAGKPMMITETAAFAGGQAQYLQQLATALPGEFPLVKALVYFDAPGKYVADTYPLDTAGMQEFVTLSHMSYFQPPRQATTTSVSVSPNLGQVRQKVELAASVPNSDNGGSVGFFVNGAPVDGCGSVPLDGLTPTCSTRLPRGNDVVTAVYSGDANYAGSTAPAQGAVMMGPWSSGSGASGTSAASGPGSGTSGSMAPFLGAPTIGAVMPLKTPGASAAETASDPGVASGSARSSRGQSGPYVIQPASALLNGTGYGLALTLAGFALSGVLAAYIVGTWVSDRRGARQRRRRA